MTRARDRVDPPPHHGVGSTAATRERSEQMSLHGPVMVGPCICPWCAPWRWRHVEGQHTAYWKRVVEAVREHADGVQKEDPRLREPGSGDAQSRTK